jgi:hypothetical protein
MNAMKYHYKEKKKKLFYEFIQSLRGGLNAEEKKCKHELLLTIIIIMAGMCLSRVPFEKRSDIKRHQMSCFRR